MQSDSAQSQGVSSKNPPSVLPLSVCRRQYNILYFVMYHCYHLDSLLLKQVLVEQLMNDSLLRLWKTGGFFLNNVQPEDDDEVDIVSIYINVVVHA